MSAWMYRAMISATSSAICADKSATSVVASPLVRRSGCPGVAGNAPGTGWLGGNTPGT